MASVELRFRLKMLFEDGVDHKFRFVRLISGVNLEMYVNILELLFWISVNILFHIWVFFTHIYKVFGNFLIFLNFVFLPCGTPTRGSMWHKMN